MCSFFKIFEMSEASSESSSAGNSTPTVRQGTSHGRNEASQLRGSKEVAQPLNLLTSLLANSDKAQVLERLESLVDDKTALKLGSYSQVQRDYATGREQVSVCGKRKSQHSVTSLVGVGLVSESPPLR